MDTIKELIGQSRSIVFFGGAGVSTESGIPDFRSEEGLYRAEAQYGHPPEEILSHRFFMRHPDVFYQYIRENLVRTDALPNPAHLALAKLEQKGKLNGIITQNIDGLHQKAGSQMVYELHGSLFRYYCLECRKSYDFDYMMDSRNCQASNSSQGFVPHCTQCGGVVRPDVVLYEESLDQAVVQGAVEALEGADTLIVGGTSLVVYPAAALLRQFRGEHLIIINQSPTSFDSKADLVIREPIGQVLRPFLEG